MQLHMTQSLAVKRFTQIHCHWIIMKHHSFIGYDIRWSLAFQFNFNKGFSNRFAIRDKCLCGLLLHLPYPLCIRRASDFIYTFLFLVEEKKKAIPTLSPIWNQQLLPCKKSQKWDSPPACVSTPLDPSGIYLFTEVSLGADCSGLFAFPM